MIGDEIDIDDTSDNDEDEDENAKPKAKDDEVVNDYRGQFAMYYARILFFAFLTDSRVKSLQEIINEIKNNTDNQRISNNLNLDKQILSLFQKHINPFILSELDYKIQNINSLANDTSISPIERASNAMKKFSRLSESEVVTPETVTDMMINALPENAIARNTKILDIASKQGEFVYAVYKKFGKDIANNFYSIPTSNIAYEFTLKVYKLLELDMKNIEANYTSYDLIKEDNLIEDDTLQVNGKKLKFDVIVGNPPYQEDDAGAGPSAGPIYDLFIKEAKKLTPEFLTIIMPSRWYAGGKGLDKFRDNMLNDRRIVELHDFLNPDIIFPNTNNRGGVCFVMWAENYDNKENLTKIYTYGDSLIPNLNIRNLKTNEIEIFIRHNTAIEINNKVISNQSFESFEKYVAGRNPFNFKSNIIKNSSTILR